MAVQGAALTAAERVAVAQFLTGRAPAAASTRRAEPLHGRDADGRSGAGPRWMAWGNDATNSRYAPQGGLTAADLPRLKLKWAFAYDGATSARVQPALAGGKLFAASDNGELHALDPKTGCTYWTYQGRVRRAQRADRRAVPQRRRHPLRRVLRRSAGQRLRRGRGDRAAGVEAQGRRAPGRGDHRRDRDCRRQGVRAGAGAERGRHRRPRATTVLHVPRQPRRRSTSTPARCCGRPTRWTSRSCAAGTRATAPDAFGPAGGGIWSSPTVDAERRSVYVATGNGYADPAQPMTDAVIAMDMRHRQGEVGLSRRRRTTTGSAAAAAKSGGNPGCPEGQGPDHDFSAAPVLATVERPPADRRPAEVGHGPRHRSRQRARSCGSTASAQGSGLGGQWGGAFDGQQAYFGVGSYQSPASRRRARRPRVRPASRSGACAAAAGAVRGHAALQRVAGRRDDGDPGRGDRRFARRRAARLRRRRRHGPLAVRHQQGVRYGQRRQGTGASIDGSPLIVGGGMIFVNSGYGGIAARPGNVLLAFGVD